MAENVMKLATKPTAKDEHRAQVIEFCRDMIAKAERGEIDGLIAAAHMPGDEWFLHYTSVLNLPPAMGYLKQAILDCEMNYLGYRKCL